MRKGSLVVALLLLLALSSCGPAKIHLYSWGGRTYDTSKYEEYAYRHYKSQSPEALCSLLVTYESMINTPGGERMVPPPGICAEYGYMLLNPDAIKVFTETATDKQKAAIVRIDYVEYGVELLEREIKYYPESKKFIEPIIKRIKHQD